MRYIRTNNFDKFKCIAERCPASCCGEWQIVIDEESLIKYADVSGEFSNRLFSSVDWHEGCFKQKNGRCAMLNDNGLCDLITNCGEDMLCFTCREYPRHTEEYEGLREKSLSISCPECAEIVLSCKDKMEFLESEDDEEDDFEEFDYLLYTKLCDAREIMYEFIQNRELSFEKKAGIIARFGEEMQALMDADKLSEMDDLISHYAELLKAPSRAQVSQKWKAKELVEILDKLELLLPNWTYIANRVNEGFCEIKLSEEEEIIAEQLLMYFVYVFFCGAVYDECIMSKAYLAVCSVYWIFQINRSVEGFDIIKSAYTYARNVEHSSLNLEDLENWFNDKIEVE